MSAGHNTDGLFALLIFLLFVNNFSAVQKQLLASFVPAWDGSYVESVDCSSVASLLLSHFLHLPRVRLGIVCPVLTS
jgi:hypothetical protein